jgi:hypothetical protein
MRKIDFGKWEARKVALHLYHPTVYSLYGCGACAISLLTGVEPSHVYADNKINNPNWPVDFVLKYLRINYFEIEELNNDNLKSDRKDVEMPINEHHPLLLVQKMTRAETSYQFIYNNLIYHNFETRPLKPLEFVNNAIDRVFLINKRSWRL